MNDSDRQRVNRPGDRTRQGKAHHERGKLDDQEQSTERRQQHQEEIPDAQLLGPDPDPEELLQEPARGNPDEQVPRFRGAGSPVDGLEKHDPGQPLGRCEAGWIQRIVGQLAERLQLDARGGLYAILHGRIQGHVDDDRAAPRPVHA